MSNLLTAQELADYLKINRATVYRWRNERGLPFKRIGPATVRYDLVEIKTWLEKQENLQQ